MHVFVANGDVVCVGDDGDVSTSRFDVETMRFVRRDSFQLELACLGGGPAQVVAAAFVADCRERAAG